MTCKGIDAPCGSNVSWILNGTDVHNRLFNSWFLVGCMRIDRDLVYRIAIYLPVIEICLDLASMRSLYPIYNASTSARSKGSRGRKYPKSPHPLANHVHRPNRSINLEGSESLLGPELREFLGDRRKTAKTGE